MVSAQHHENDKRQPRKRMTIEQMTDMQANKIIGDLGLDDKTAAKFKDVYMKYMIGIGIGLSLHLSKES